MDVDVVGTIRDDMAVDLEQTGGNNCTKAGIAVGVGVLVLPAGDGGYEVILQDFLGAAGLGSEYEDAGYRGRGVGLDMEVGG
jgi:hypothetical protein